MRIHQPEVIRGLGEGETSHSGGTMGASPGQGWPAPRALTAGALWARSSLGRCGHLALEPKCGLHSHSVTETLCAAGYLVNCSEPLLLSVNKEELGSYVRGDK